MQSVYGASGRWGMGKPGSTRYAFFITRYPLHTAPKNDTQTKQVIEEAQRSLYQTGAAGRKLYAKQVKIAKQNAWYYHFSIPGVDVQLWLIMHKSDKSATLYQFSCQSELGKRGRGMRRGCREVLDGLKFP